MIGKIWKIPLNGETEFKQKGMVYRVNIGNKYYIGSTKLPLSLRASKHNYKIKNGSKTKFHQEAIKNNIFKVKCEEIYCGEDYIDVENKMILESLEDKNCLNMIVVKQTKERKKELSRKRGDCKLCGKEIMKKNMARHLRQMHHVTKFDIFKKKAKI